MSDLVGNPEDRFSRVMAQIILFLFGYMRAIIEALMLFYTP